MEVVENLAPELSADRDCILFGIDPELYQHSKDAHIGLTIAHSVFAPLTAFGAIVGVTVMIQIPSIAGKPTLSPEFWFFIATSTLEVFAWSGLCMLFFKKHHPRWHRAVWSLCCVYGVAATPYALYFCYRGFWDSDAFGGVLFSLIATLAIFSAAQGFIHARRAHQSVRRMNRLRDQACLNSVSS